MIENGSLLQRNNRTKSLSLFFLHITIIIISLFSGALYAGVSGPTESSSGTFTLSYSGTYGDKVIRQYRNQTLENTYSLPLSTNGQITINVSNNGSYEFQLWTIPPGCMQGPPGSCSTLVIYGSHIISVQLDTGSIPEYSGFNDAYEIKRGDINSDGKLDLYIRQSPQVSSVAPVNDFILRNNGDGSFVKISPTSTQRSSASGWSSINIPNFISDIDFNGKADLTLADVSDFIPGAYDQIVFSAIAGQSAPKQVTALSPDVEKFSTQVFDWSLNPDYFDENAPWIIVGQEPPTRIYYGTSFSSSNIDFINFLLASCENDGYFCATSSIDPPVGQCEAVRPLYNQYGEIGGYAMIDVCLYDTHVFRYEPGSITREKSYSFFNQNALEFAEEVGERMPNGVQDIDNTSPGVIDILGGILRDIIKREFGVGIFDNDPNMSEESFALAESCHRSYGYENFAHPSFSVDSLYDDDHPSFHHYDVRTKVCTDGQSGCSNQNIGNTLKLFSYPSFLLRPTQTPLDNVTDVMARFAPTLLVTKPSGYFLPLGHVSQRLYTTANWPSSVIENKTRTSHLMHPGAISRTVESKDGGKYIFTHGIGENNRGTLLDELIDKDDVNYNSSQALNMMLGCLNGVFGPQTFKTLDKEAVKYWQQQNQATTASFMMPSSTEGALGTVNN